MSLRSEAECLWPMFSRAKNGAAVMDGEGNIFQFNAKDHVWIGSHCVVFPLRMAQSLCPDLAAEFAQIAEEESHVVAE